MRLNPTKCSFGVTFGKFVGYLVINRGIEANLDQIRAVLDMPSLKNKRDIQRLAGRVAALNSFIPKSSDQCLLSLRSLKATRNSNGMRSASLHSKI